MLSIWERDSFYKPVDVLVVGGGLMGLWTAYELKKNSPTLEVLIVEKHPVPLGASTRNAGFACFGSATELLHDAEIMDVDSVLQTVEQRFKGIQKIRQVLGDDRFGFEDCGGHECLRKEDRHFEGLADKLSWLNLLLYAITNDADTFTMAPGAMEANGLTGFDTLIATRFEGALHSGKLVQALTQMVQQLGVKIMYGQQIFGWHQTTNKLVVEAAHQKFITRKMVVAINGFTSHLLPQLRIEPARGQVLVTHPVAGLKLHGTFHFDEGFYYWRHLGDRILLGGARNMAMANERTDELEVTDQIQQCLESFLAKHILATYKMPAGGWIAHRWAGLMGFTQDKKPLVVTTEPNVWATICCNGMGVALAPMIAEQIADNILKG